MAHAFAPRFGMDPDVTVFASGVSNSLETRPEEFARERSLLCQILEQNQKRLVYFGSCGAVAEGEPLTPYMMHKRSMENLVLSSSGGLVLRLPQVVGITSNPHTLTNFLRDRILSGEHFTVWKYAERNLIDVEDVAAIGSAIATDPDFNQPAAISIAAKTSIAVPAIVNILERILDRRANCTAIQRGSPLLIDAGTAVKVGSRLGIDLGSGYIENVVRKYYDQRDASPRGHSPPFTTCK